jgi:thiamine-phosphate pyrophosphorylase
VAIAGITVERAPDVLKAGADSLAVVTDIITHPDPERRVGEWLKLVAANGA